MSYRIDKKIDLLSARLRRYSGVGLVLRVPEDEGGSLDARNGFPPL
jgi:hypothetical protein